MSVAVATRMPVEELGAALAMHCKLFKADRRAARRELDVAQRSYFDEGCAWADSNANVIKLIHDDPQSIAADNYSLSEARGWFSRLIGLGRSRSASPPADDELERLAKDLRSNKRQNSGDSARQKRLAELSKLVDEAL